MLQSGALEEVSAFVQKIQAGEIPANSPLTKALGYASLAAHLEGKKSQEEASAETKQDTRHYAKRQMTWFRNQIKADVALEKPDAAKILEYLEL